MGTVLIWPDDDDVDEVAVVTDTNESVDVDVVNDDEAEFELLDELSVGLFVPMWPSFCKIALRSLPPVSLSSTYRWWPETQQIFT